MRRLIVLLSLLSLLIFAGALVNAQEETNAQGQVIYVVQPGDTLYRIALRNNTTVSALAAANNILNPNLIYVGQRLVIPTPGAPPPPTATPRPATPTPVSPGPATPIPPGTTIYIVAPGDTLFMIAQRFVGVTYLDIARANNIVNPNLIYVGQRLTIPLPGQLPPAPTPTPRPPTPVPPGNTPVPPSGAFELGGQVISFAYPVQMQGAGMTWVKHQVVYNQGDPASIAQDEIQAAHSQGFKSLISVMGNPAQIAANPAQYNQDFAAFVAGVAALGPDAIEVWNEPNIDRSWPQGQISGAAYTQMLTASYQAIKSANSAVLVISAAPAPTGFFGGRCTANGCDDNIFLQQMASAGAGQFFDCLGIHYNEGILPPTATSGDPRGSSTHYTRYYPTMVSTYRGIFPNKPLCFTELGYLSPDGLGPLPPAFSWAANTSAQEQAEWLAQAARQARQSGFVRMLIVWNVDATRYDDDPQAGYAIVRGNQCLACNTLGALMNPR